MDVCASLWMKDSKHAFLRNHNPPLMTICTAIFRLSFFLRPPARGVGCECGLWKGHSLPYWLWAYGRARCIWGSIARKRSSCHSLRLARRLKAAGCLFAGILTVNSLSCVHTMYNYNHWLLYRTKNKLVWYRHDSRVIEEGSYIGARTRQPPLAMTLKRNIVKLGVPCQMSCSNESWDRWHLVDAWDFLFNKLASLMIQKAQTLPKSYTGSKYISKLIKEDSCYR